MILLGCRFSVALSAGQPSVLVPYVIYDIQYSGMESDKVLIWLHGQIKTPPMSPEARIEAGYLLRRLQRGEKLSMPHVRPMPNVDKRCFELRIRDVNVTWRIVYRTDADAIVIVDVFGKKTRTTPDTVIKSCRKRLKEYDDASRQT